jgi:hypothetical protein
MFLNKALIIAVSVTVLFSCETKNYSQLKVENDSLRQEIEFRNDILIAMDEVNSIADSIMNLHGLKNEHSAQYQKYLQRIEYLHQSLLVSHDRIGKVNNELANSREEAEAYNLMVISLQDEVSLRDNELSDQQKLISNNHRKYSGNLTALEKVIAEKDRELTRLQNAMEEIKRMNAAESYFIKGQRLEEKASRIIFAQRKKKESLREALELYHQSYLLGKLEALVNIRSLKKKLGAN